MPPSTPPELDALKALLKETHALAAENNRLLHEMRRNAILGMIARIIIWLIVLGVPLFFLSAYIGPIIDAVNGTGGAGALPSSLFGLPSANEIVDMLNRYQSE